MNMYGIIQPAHATASKPPGLARRLRGKLWRSRWFLLIVMIPTVLLAGYLFLIASDQYQSETHFLVRTAETQPVPGIGVSQALNSVTGLSSAQSEAMSVSDYLTSHDAVLALRRDAGLVERFTRPGIDWLSGLGTTVPTPEKLLKYYRKQVVVDYSTETGITTLAVRSFTPEDSYLLTRRLLAMGERRVNEMNRRSFNDAIAVSQRQLAEAERDLARNQALLTRFRESRREIDPTASGEAQLGLVTTLSGQLASARAQLNAMRGLINPSAPQFRALQAHVAALSAQVAGQSSRLVGSSGSIASNVGGYEDLRLRQEFLSKRYDAAATAFQRAREQALRQQLYVVRVVEPNLPVRALYPERWRILATAFVGLLLAYAIGWLLAAGVREHAA